MKVRINREERQLGPGTTLADLVEGDSEGVAIAHNGQVVPRSRWASTSLADGDAIELVKAVPGG